MEAIVFAGLPGSGKSSYFKEHFFHTHVRISLDLLKTRHREMRLLETCLETDQRLVIDNTNVTRHERARFIRTIRSTKANYKLTGYYFASRVKECLARNGQRKEQVPDVAILAGAKNLERPSLSEGFDQLYYVRLIDGGFRVEEWNDAI